MAFFTVVTTIRILTLINRTSLPFARPPLSDLAAVFSALDANAQAFCALDTNDLNAQLLELYSRSVEKESKLGLPVQFVCQNSLPDDQRYYEQIIFEEGCVPTRKHSWHDFFNGLVWLSFPKTKAYLNQLHIEQINTHGLHPRTKVRNHLTHFDECGVVLFIDAPLYSSVKALFEKQDWLGLFCGLSHEWHTSIRPFIFGHANLEMLLAPFIGLTAKVLLISLDQSASRHLNGSSSHNKNETSLKVRQYHAFDEILCQHLESEQIFFTPKPFFPLPLLGVPGWHYGEQNQDFYTNTNYFMPKRQREAGVS